MTSVGLAAVVVCLLASMVTRSENSLGPLYVLGSFATFIGVILFSIAALVGRVVPWWVGPALTVTWIVGGPVGDGGPLGLKGAALLSAAAVTAISAAVRKIS